VNSPDPLHRRLGAWLWRRPQRWFLLGIPAGGLAALLVGVALTASFVGGMKLMGTDAFCTSCHEMDAPHQELMQASHFSNAFGIRASCGDCHVPPTLLAGLARHMQSYAEVWGHLTGELNTPAKFESHRLALAQKVWKELGSIPPNVAAVTRLRAWRFQSSPLQQPARIRPWPQAAVPASTAIGELPIRCLRAVELNRAIRIDERVIERRCRIAARAPQRARAPVP